MPIFREIDSSPRDYLLSRFFRDHSRRRRNISRMQRSSQGSSQRRMTVPTSTPRTKEKCQWKFEVSCEIDYLAFLNVRLGRLRFTFLKIPIFLSPFKRHPFSEISGFTGEFNFASRWVNMYLDSAWPEWQADDTDPSRNLIVMLVCFLS